MLQVPYKNNCVTTIHHSEHLVHCCARACFTESVQHLCCSSGHGLLASSISSLAIAAVLHWCCSLTRSVACALAIIPIAIDLVVQSRKASCSWQADG